MMKLIDFLATKAFAGLKPDWFKPELGYIFVTFYMNMGRFIMITRVEKETI